MPENNGSDRLDRIERMLEETNQTLVRTIKAFDERMDRTERSFNERQDRIQRHLDVLIDVVDGLIRDRRFKELEKRVSDLEEGKQS